MKALPANRRSEVMTSLGIEPGPKLTRVADSEQPSVRGKMDRRDAMKTIFASGLGLSALANGSSEAKEPDSEKVKLKDGRTLTKDEYFDWVITNATNDGILKSPDAFKIKDLSGQEIVDRQGYKKYVESIKERAGQFKDPKDFSRFINTIRTLRDTPGSDNAVLTSRQVEFLVEYPSIHQTADIVATLFGGLKYDGVTIDQARIKADELIRKLEESKFKSTAISSK